MVEQAQGIQRRLACLILTDALCVGSVLGCGVFLPARRDRFSDSVVVDDPLVAVCALRSAVANVLPSCFP